MTLNVWSVDNSFSRLEGRAVIWMRPYSIAYRAVNGIVFLGFSYYMSRQL